jgi:murein DD-endopeptidase MepM/ murein hydrolase activator NlpD
MQDKFCELRLPDGRVWRFEYGRAKLLATCVCLVLLVAVGGAGWFYAQLSDYRREAEEFAAYKEHKEEQRSQLEKLLQDNERMLRDMAEISNLEKKLRRAIIRDVDSSKLGVGNAALGDAPEQIGSYTGQGGSKELNVRSSMEILAARNENMSVMIANTKRSVSQLLGEMEGRGGTLASFPDKWPTDGGVISSNYGGRVDPVSKGYEYHQGLDIAVDFGTPVYATAAGMVAQAGWNGGYGRYVRLNHGNGYETAYGHMSGLAVNAGQRVAKGEIIGFVGSTGYSTGPHLHYEVMADGQNVDPFYVMKTK